MSSISTKKHSFHVSVSSSANMFDLIHIDIWGPTISAMNCSRYFLTIVDDYTRFTWVITIKSENEVADIIPSFCTMIIIQFGKSIKVIRSDNGPEFKIFPFYEKNGILHQTSCVGTPQQNGLAEGNINIFLMLLEALKYKVDCLHLFGIFSMIMICI